MLGSQSRRGVEWNACVHCPGQCLAPERGLSEAKWLPLNPVKWRRPWGLGSIQKATHRLPPTVHENEGSCSWAKMRVNDKMYCKGKTLTLGVSVLTKLSRLREIWA